MEEIISIHIGQAGVIAGNTVWESFALDHGIQSDGYIPDQAFQLKPKEDQNLQAFFKETGNGKLVPRAVFIDLEPDSINVVRQGYFSKLHFPEQLINGKEDANIFSKGYHTIGKELSSIAMDRIRQQVDSCRNCKGFMVYLSVGGGTGSGLGSLIIEQIKNEFPKKCIIVFPIFPTPKLSQSFVDPYNTILASHHLLKDPEPVSILLENQAIYDICQDQLQIEQPTLKDLNKVIARHIRDITASIRFNGSLLGTIDEFQINLVPFPRMCFLNSSYSPFLPNSQSAEKYPSLVQITSQSFESSNQFIKSEIRQGKFMACSLTYRGQQIVPKDVCPAICKIKTERTIQFVDWCPTGFKCGINYLPNLIEFPDGSSKEMNSVSGLSNTSAIKSVFEKYANQFDSMYGKRAFVHQYLAEGMEEHEFLEAKEDIANLLNDYQEVEKESEEAEAES